MLIVTVRFTLTLTMKNDAISHYPTVKNGNANLAAKTTPSKQGGSFFARENLLALLIMAIILLATLVSWYFLARGVDENRQSHFSQKSADIVSSIRVRLFQHEQILLGAAALFNTDHVVDHEEFHHYASSLMLNQRYPGMLAVGFAPAVARADLESHINQMQAVGFPHYSVHSAGAASLLIPVTFIDPFVGRNLLALGYDMYSEPVRKRALQRAAEQGVTTITDKVTLVQENPAAPQAGFLMYVPVYKKNSSLTTPAERMQALRGFSFSPCRINDLMAGILGNNADGIDFKINVGSNLQESSMLYDSTQGKAPAQAGLLSTKMTISAYGQTWLINLQSQPAFDASYNSSLPLVVLLMGISIAALLFFLLSSTMQQRNRAIRLAMTMTEEIRAQSDQLQLSEQRFALAMRGANDGLWDRDLDSGNVYFSARWKYMLGYEDHELISHQDEWLKRVHPDDTAALIKKEQLYIDGKTERFQNEYRLRHRDGHYIWVLDRGWIDFGDDGKLHRLIGTITDISERKRVDKLKSEFISTVSHELRTPLTSISASLGLLEAGVFGDLPAKALGLVSIASKNSKRLTMLVNDILDMEKLVSGKTVFRTDQIDMLQLVKQAIELNTEYATSYGVHFTLVAAKVTAKVTGDKDRLMQVMANLMSNAAKFSIAGGAVEIRLSSKDNQLRIEIEDHGPGIPDEFQHRIFSEFAQADSSDSRQQGGTGLGLNITKKLVERMDGEIGYRTELGQGTTFWFTLPHTTFNVI